MTGDTPFSGNLHLDFGWFQWDRVGPAGEAWSILKLPSLMSPSRYLKVKVNDSGRHFKKGTVWNSRSTKATTTKVMEGQGPRRPRCSCLQAGLQSVCGMWQSCTQGAGHSLSGAKVRGPTWKRGKGKDTSVHRAYYDGNLENETGPAGSMSLFRRSVCS